MTLLGATISSTGNTMKLVHPKQIMFSEHTQMLRFFAGVWSSILGVLHKMIEELTKKVIKAELCRTHESDGTNPEPNKVIE